MRLTPQVRSVQQVCFMLLEQRRAVLSLAPWIADLSLPMPLHTLAPSQRTHQVMLAQQRAITALIEAVNSAQLEAQAGAAELLRRGGRRPAPQAAACGGGGWRAAAGAGEEGEDAASQHEAAMAGHRLER